MKETLLKITDKTIEYSFYLLFFLVPLILTPFNYELFEYNKMIVTYGLTTIIVGSFITKMILTKQILLTRTPLDIPILLFLISQILSTIFSIDRHVSIWGYYSRFNGGLLSLFSYVLLYYAFVASFSKEKIKKLLTVMLTTGVLVATYGILEHLGIDKDIWVQDVQNRVFSTLGQPNWLAAYLAVLIPLTMGLGLNPLSYISLESNHKVQSNQVKTINPYFFIYFFISIIFYITLIFTKSRSGFLGLWTSLIVFWLFSICSNFICKNSSPKAFQNQARANFWKEATKPLSIFIILLLAITFFLGAPFHEINRFTLPELIKSKKADIREAPAKPTGTSIIDVGITESGTIRRIVWKGALEIARHYPLFGSGVETFAFAYYKFRPVEHNMTSEWDFLYNKAHNEYLNYAATTGVFGLGSYLLLIGIFIWWNIKKLKVQSSNVKLSSKFKAQNGLNNLDFGFDLKLWILIFGLFCSWLSILITNFFGFSVVIIQLFFFLIPAISFVLNGNLKPAYLYKSGNINMKQTNDVTISSYQKVIILILFSIICYLLYVIFRLWYADTLFATGYHASRSQEYVLAYQALKRAILENDSEPFYFDELSYPAALLAVAAEEEKQSTLSSQLKKEAILASNLSVGTSPNNVNYWKTRTRMFYVLSQMEEKYLNQAKESLEQAKILSPTDPKIRYNLALLEDQLGKRQEAITLLSETTKLKPDYRDAYFALAYIYEQNKQRDLAKETYNYILTHIASDDAEVKERLKELK